MITLEKHIFEQIRSLAYEAGEIIIELKGSHTSLNTHLKEEGVSHSVVTKADLAAHQKIMEGLKKITPNIPIVSEEADLEENKIAIASGEYWIVDPLDGTKSFITGEKDYTVNIGRIKDRVPIFGLIYVPELDLFYWGDGSGAWKQKSDNKATKISVSNSHVVKNVVASKNHLDERTKKFILQFGKTSTVSIGSSLKICQVAEGVAEIYPRFAPTMEWDTAAGDAILRAAGGKSQYFDGSELVYGKSNIQNEGFIFSNGKLKFQIN